MPKKLFFSIKFKIYLARLLLSLLIHTVLQHTHTHTCNLILAAFHSPFPPVLLSKHMLSLSGTHSHTPDVPGKLYSPLQLVIVVFVVIAMAALLPLVVAVVAVAMFCCHLRFAISTRFNNGPIVPKANVTKRNELLLLMANGQVVKLNRIPAWSWLRLRLRLGLAWPGATENFVFASLFNVHVIEMHLQLNYK